MDDSEFCRHLDGHVVSAVVVARRSRNVDVRLAAYSVSRVQLQTRHDFGIVLHSFSVWGDGLRAVDGEFLDQFILAVAACYGSSHALDLVIGLGTVGSNGRAVGAILSARYVEFV